MSGEEKVFSLKSKKSIIINGIWFFAVFGLTIAGVLHGKDLGDLAECITECNELWLIPALVCVLIFIASESLILWEMFQASQIKVQRGVCFLFSAIGFFFSSITPSASGGQPMQLYFMKKERIPVPVASVILIIVTITYKAVLVILGLGVVIFANNFLHFYFDEVLPIFYLGIFLNVICVAVMFMMLVHPTMVKSILMWIVHIVDKMHIVKKTEELCKKIDDAVVSYRDTSAFMFSHIRLMLKVFFITVCQRMSLFAIPCFVYKAFRLSGSNLFGILILQGLVAVAVDMLPLPGGMGISETLFMLVFDPIFGEVLLPGMILSRGMGYYGMLCLSGIFTLLAVVVFAARKKNLMTVEE